MTPIESTNLVAYDYADGRFSVQFKSGHVFSYAGVPEKVVTAFEQAPSKGSFYAHEIRGQFQSEKVTGSCPSCGDIGRNGTACTDCGTAQYGDAPR